MYIAILREDSRVLYVFNTETADDDTSLGIEVSPEVFEQMWSSGRFGDWLYGNGTFSHDPEPAPPVSGEAPAGEIPQAVL